MAGVVSQYLPAVLTGSRAIPGRSSGRATGRPPGRLAVSSLVQFTNETGTKHGKTGIKPGEIGITSLFSLVSACPKKPRRLSRTLFPQFQGLQNVQTYRPIHSSQHLAPQALASRPLRSLALLVPLLPLHPRSQRLRVRALGSLGGPLGKLQRLVSQPTCVRALDAWPMAPRPADQAGQGLSEACWHRALQHAGRIDVLAIQILRQAPWRKDSEAEAPDPPTIQIATKIPLDNSKTSRLFCSHESI